MTLHDDLVFDVGLHIGQDAEFYLAKGFRVVGVEALGELCEKVAARLGDDVDSGRLHLENVAIADRPGPVTFYLSSISVWGTTRPQWSERNAALGAESRGTVTVTGATFQELLEKHGVPYYLKVDIEGADLLCLEALDGLATRPAFVSIESDKTSWSAMRHEFDLLRDLGYDRFKIVPQHKVERQVPPDPPREGQKASWRFSDGASGLFGEEAPGRWLTRRQALLVYTAIHLRYKLVGDRSVLMRPTDGRVVTFVRRALLVSALLVVGRPGWFDTHAGRTSTCSPPGR